MTFRTGYIEALASQTSVSKLQLLLCITSRWEFKVGCDPGGKRDAASQCRIHPDARPCPPGSPLVILKHNVSRCPIHGGIKRRVLSHALLTICLSEKPKRVQNCLALPGSRGSWERGLLSRKAAPN